MHRSWRIYLVHFIFDLTRSFCWSLVWDALVELMLSQAGLILVRFPTVIALKEIFLALMHHHVLAEIWARDELFATRLTLVRLLSRVDPLVSDQIAYLWKGSPTLVAQIWSGLFMDAAMVFLKWTKLRETLIAQGALVWTLPSVSSFMLLQGLLTCEGLFTSFDAADEFFLFYFRWKVHFFRLSNTWR